MFFSWRSGLAASVAAGLLLGVPAFAAQSPDAEAPSATTPAAPAAPALEPANIQGFRSAHFAMDESQILQAIRRDFSLSDKEIIRGKNEAEGTTFVQILADKLMPIGGKARVTYVMGFTSKNLVQVNIAWGLAAGKPESPEALVGAANLLRQHFQQHSYRPKSVLVNGQLPDGTLIAFRGVDEDGHAVLLVLSGDRQPGDGPPTIKPTTLILSYIKDPENQDVIKLKPGAF